MLELKESSCGENADIGDVMSSGSRGDPDVNSPSKVRVISPAVGPKTKSLHGLWLDLRASRSLEQSNKDLKKLYVWLCHF